MTRLVARWCVIGIAVSLSGVVPASAQSGTWSGTRLIKDEGAKPGELHGIVRDARGKPLADAVVHALGSISVFDLSDREGHFGFRNLPPGAYLVRVYLSGYLPGCPRSVVVGSESRQMDPIALSRLGSETRQQPRLLAAGVGAVDGPAPARAAGACDAEDRPDQNEVAFRLKHAPRSVLKDSQHPASVDDLFGAPSQAPNGDRLATALATGFPSLNGQVNLLTVASFEHPQDLFSSEPERPRTVAYLALEAPATGGEWRFRGALTQGDLASWMLAGSFVRRTGSRHEYEAGLSYAMQRYQGGNADALAATRDGGRNVGTIYAYDTWTLNERISVRYGTNIAKYDYLDDEQRMLMSPQASVILQPLAADSLRLRATASHRESAPGAGEFLPPGAGMAMPPERTFSPLGEYGFRPERVGLVEIAADRRWEGDLVVGVRAFRQFVDDQTVTLFGLSQGEDASPGIGHYHVASAGDFRADGWGVSASRAIGGGLHAAIDYTQADAIWMRWSPDAEALASVAGSLLRTAERIHDLTASVDSVVAPTATRVLVLYKMNSAFADAAPDGDAGMRARFDVQVNQSLPFLAATGAQWEMLIAVSNLFRSAAAPHGSLYDELLVLRAPTRVTGGVTLRF